MTDSVPIATLISAVEQASSAAQLVPAVQALAAVRSEAGISPLIAVLGYNNPTAALAAVEGLISMGQAAVPDLIAQLDDYNYGARAYAIRALATIADPQALDVLVTAAANDFAPSVRRAAAKGLGNLHWHQLEPEQRHTDQTIALETLLSVAADPDWSIRYAAVVGLQGLLAVPDLSRQIQPHLAQMMATETDLAVRARVQLAIDAAANNNQ